LWVPSEERRQKAQLTRYRQWLAETHGLRFAVGDYQSLWRWSVDELEDFYASVWEYFAVDADPGYDAVLGRREMPGAEWFPGARLNYAHHVFRGKTDDEVAVRFASERAGPDGGAGGGAAQRRRRARRPGGRLPAQHPRGAGRRPGRDEPRGDLVGLLTGLRRPQRGRPLRPDRAGGAAGGGRVPLRRAGPQPAGRGAVAAGGAPVAAADGAVAPPRPPGRRVGAARHRPVGVLRRTRRNAAVRERAVGPSAVGRVLVGHDRAAEAHRPLPWRDARRPAEVRPL